MSLNKKVFHFDFDNCKFELNFISITIDGVLWILFNPFVSLLGLSYDDEEDKTNFLEYKFIKKYQKYCSSADSYSINDCSKFINETGLYKLIKRSKDKGLWILV